MCTTQETIWPVSLGRHVGRQGWDLDTRPSISLVIPTLNESANLPHVLPHIPAWVDETLIVDGRSTDDSVAVATQILPSAQIVMVDRPGKGAALRAGFQAATGDIVVMMDADGSMNPAEIGQLVRHLRAGADFVKGSRFLQGAGSADITLLRRLGNGALTVLVRILYGGRYSDLCYGFAAFWRSVLPELDLDGDGFEIETQMNIRALRAKLRIIEVPSYEFPRHSGTSNLRTFPDGWRVLRTILREPYRKPSRRGAFDPSHRQ